MTRLTGTNPANPLTSRTRTTTETEAFAELERVYGSLDDFMLRFYSLPDDRQELFFAGAASWDTKAATVGMSKATVMFLFLKSDTFARALSQFAARDAWNGLAQRRALSTLARDVQDTTEKIPHRVAGIELLNKSIKIEEKEEEQKGQVININIGDGHGSLSDLRTMIEQQDLQARTITIEGLPDEFQEEVAQAETQESPNHRYRPGRSGDEPPEGVRRLEAVQARRLTSSDALLPKTYGARLGSEAPGAPGGNDPSQNPYGGRVSKSVGESPTDTPQPDTEE
jgi:predicted ribosome quality control (RQC) complex YloA/Tae2 family protein